MGRLGASRVRTRIGRSIRSSGVIDDVAEDAILCSVAHMAGFVAFDRLERTATPGPARPLFTLGTVNRLNVRHDSAPNDSTLTTASRSIVVSRWVDVGDDDRHRLDIERSSGGDGASAKCMSRMSRGTTYGRGRDDMLCRGVASMRDAAHAGWRYRAAAGDPPFERSRTAAARPEVDMAVTPTWPCAPDDAAIA